MLKQVLEVFDLLDDAAVCGVSVAASLKETGLNEVRVETVKGERFSDLRVAQAVDARADVLATACPYCIANFEDSRLALKDETALEIKDVTEIVAEVIG